MPSRNKVLSTQIENGIITITCYSAPTDGPQEINATIRYNVHELPTPMILNLAAVGFGAVLGNRHQNTEGHPDIPAIAAHLFAEMQTSDWKPGKRDATTNEPTDLMKALAEATNKPIHVVQHEFETRVVTRNDGTVYRDNAGKTRRFFSAAVQRELAADVAVLPILARMQQERARALAAQAKGNKEPSKLATLFDDRPTAEAAQ